MSQRTERNPEVSTALVLRVGAEVLMLRRQNGKIQFPGGHVEWGETLDGALKREIREELSYELEGTPRFLDLYNYVAPDLSQHIVMLHYIVILQSKPTFTLGDDEKDSDVLWLSREEVGKIMHTKEFVDAIFG